jgi:hypothetical protein
LANIPIDGNIQSLLSTKIGRNKPQKYINFEIESYSDLRNVFVKVYDRCIYIFTYVVTNRQNQYRLYRYNLLTNQPSLAWGSNNNLGIITDFLMSDNGKMYLSVNGNRYLWIIDMNLNTETKWDYTSNKNPICFGKLEWIEFNKKFIMLDAGPNLLTFDIVDNSISYIPMTGGYTGGDDYCVGEKYIFTTRTRYDITNETATTYVLPNRSNPTSVAYNNGKYYFAMSNSLYMYDESTDTWSSQISIGWTNPIELHVNNGNCYAVNNNSNKAYLYDLSKQMIYSFLMKWNVPTRGASALTRSSIYEGTWLISRDTLCYIMHESNLKYNAGPIVQHIKLLYNKSTKDSYIYDDRFIKFTDTYVTIQDGILQYPDIDRGLVLETLSEERHIYAISISKDDYKVLKKINV